ncbi:MAG: aspartate--tRNA ligase [bacterium]
MRRTHTCGELKRIDSGKTVTLMGWVHRRRDHGGLIFVDIRDRYGMTQVIFNPENTQVHKRAHQLKPEYVIEVKGRVRERPGDMVNLKLPTGEIEVVASHLEILNESKVPPFVLEDDVKATEELRLRYRFMDMRRNPVKDVFLLRARVCRAIREHLDRNGFVELETPYLTRSTPEGARDFLVPSRLQPGRFYCLAQSPQLYKQLLMTAGFDRYYQFARCFRDEDMRGDRQPEHTQIDIEMSFVDEDDVFRLAEGMFAHAFKEALGVELRIPFERLTYEESMQNYGTDKPDLRFGLKITDVTDIASRSDFKAFREEAESGGKVECLKVDGGSSLSRKEIDSLGEVARNSGATGIAWMKREEGTLSGPLSKFFQGSPGKQIENSVGAKAGDLILFIAGRKDRALSGLGAVRTELGRRSCLPREPMFIFCWITDFPLFEYSEEEGKWVPTHHIFSMPRDITMLDGDPGEIKGKVYDLVCNGVELASGSIRIHRRDIQEKVMKIVGMSHADAEKRFGFLLKAFDYGAPPHGGIAPGIDRIVALMAGKESIRDVIAFPKTLTGSALLEDAPSEVDPEQLEELNIEVKTDRKRK